MKKIIFFLLLVLPFFLVAQDDDDLTLVQLMNIKVKPGHGSQLNAGLKAHNQKFHQEGMSKVNVWRVRSGPRTGTLQWIQGPMNWGKFDTPISEEHMADWGENVSPHGDVEDVEFWRLQTDLNYVPDGFSAAVLQVRFLDIKPEKGNNMRKLFQGIVEVYEKNNLKRGFQIYTNQANSGDNRDWAMIWSYDSWSQMDKALNFSALYEEIHGENSWDEFFELLDDARDPKGMEIISLIPELSAVDEN